MVFDSAGDGPMLLKSSAQKTLHSQTICMAFDSESESVTTQQLPPLPQKLSLSLSYNSLPGKHNHAPSRYLRIPKGTTR